MVNQSQADQKSFEKLRPFFHKERGHMVGFISNLAPLLNYLRKRSPAPPFPPDFRQAGERGAKNRPHIRKPSLDHDSGVKQIGAGSHFLVYFRLLVFSCVAHTSPSLTGRLAILNLHAYHFPRLQNLKSPSATPRADCQDLRSLGACASDYG